MADKTYMTFFEKRTKLPRGEKMKTINFRVEKIGRKWISISIASAHDPERRFGGKLLKTEWLHVQPDICYSLAVIDESVRTKHGTKLVFEPVTPQDTEAEALRLEVATAVAILKAI